MRKSLLIFVVILFSCPVISGQIKEGPLKSGDLLPDLIINGVINNPAKQIKLSDLKAELIIIDLFSIHCGTCIRYLNKYDSLQSVISGVQFLPVTNTGIDILKNQIEKNGWKLPFGINDNEHLYSYFPHTIVSHLVWIKDSKVLAITGAEEANAGNIQKIINGGAVALKEKIDLVDYTRSKPLLIDGNGGSSEKLQFQSVFTDYLPGIPGGYSKLDEGVKVINSPVIEMYKRIFSDGEDENYWFRFNNRVKLEISDTSLIRLVRDNEILFSYSLTLPVNKEREEIREIAIQDINRFFGIKYRITGRIEKKNVECLVINVIDEKLLSSRGGEPYRQEDEEGNLILRNQRMKILQYILAFNLKDTPYPVIDHSGYMGTLDLQLPSDIKDLKVLKEALNKQGLDIVKKEITLDMLVISDQERNKYNMSHQ
ncbi:MAG: TlpA family protein disulfide reductase [Candidatus Cyclobacteriaceae bacterium M2_1C_046]